MGGLAVRSPRLAGHQGDLVGEAGDFLEEFMIWLENCTVNGGSMSRPYNLGAEGGDGVVIRSEEVVEGSIERRQHGGDSETRLPKVAWPFASGSLANQRWSTRGGRAGWGGLVDG